MSAFILADMTWPEVKTALETVKIAIIPVGAHEQHGPHMAESCDGVLAEAMSKKLAERLYPDVIVAPTISMGISPHHMNFPGTITLRPETLISLLRDMVTSLKQHGIDKFLFINGHGGNQPTLSVASTMLTQELGVECYHAKTTASAKEAFKKHVTSKLYGHSCEREVSEALYLAPHIVREDLLEKGDIIEGGRWEGLRPGQPIQGYYTYDEMTRNGCIGDATKASLQAGEDIVEEALEGLAGAVRQILEQ
ncbi:MAG: creatininase family protein [Saccharospirillum sp.]|uniref:creatininase family protein n=1 Tax=Saccharospirillum sp. TaxID=2033801 RepID=UPI003299A8DF